MHANHVRYAMEMGVGHDKSVMCARGGRQGSYSEPRRAVATRNAFQAIRLVAAATSYEADIYYTCAIYPTACLDHAIPRSTLYVYRKRIPQWSASTALSSIPVCAFVPVGYFQAGLKRK
jgi:hypothetical protein